MQIDNAEIHEPRLREFCGAFESNKKQFCVV